MAIKFPKLKMPASQLHELQKDWAVSQAADFQNYLRKTKPTAVIEGEWPVLPPRGRKPGRLLAESYVTHVTRPHRRSRTAEAGFGAAKNFHSPERSRRSAEGPEIRQVSTIARSFRPNCAESRE